MSRYYYILAELQKTSNMKKIITLTIAIGFVSCLYCQLGIQKTTSFESMTSNQNSINYPNLNIGEKTSRVQGALKNLLANSLQLDSMITSQYSYSDSVNVQIKYKEVYRFDNNGKDLGLTVYEWDTARKQFFLSVKEDYRYDADNNIDLIEEYDWDSTLKQWVYYNKDEYTFDANGHEISHAFYLYDVANKKFDRYLKTENTYFPDGKQKEYIYYTTSADTFIRFSRSVYIYDINGYRSEVKGYSWNEDSTRWDYSADYLYSGDASGNDTLLLVTEKNFAGVFKSTYKYQYSYNTNGKLTVLTMSYWDQVDTWLKKNRFQYNYNADGSGSTGISYGFDDVSSKWLSVGILSYDYDKAYTGSSPLFPKVLYYKDAAGFYTKFKAEAIIQKFRNPLDTSKWYISSTKYLYYSDKKLPGGIVISSAVVAVYPNPAAGSVRIVLPDETQTASVRMLSIEGLIVLEKTNYSSGEELSISTVNSGTYVLEVTSNFRTYYSKITVLGRD
jgi:hypothetical protein